MRLFQRRGSTPPLPSQSLLTLPLEGSTESKSIIRCPPPESNSFKWNLKLAWRNTGGSRLRSPRNRTRKQKNVHEELLRLVEGRQGELLGLYQDLRFELDTLMERKAPAAKITEVRQLMGACQDELLNLQEEYKLMLFRFGTTEQPTPHIPALDTLLTESENHGRTFMNRRNSTNSNMSQPPRTAPIRIREFKVVELIGKGAHGFVYKASVTPTTLTPTTSTTTTQGMGNLVAIKVISKASLDRWYKVQALDQEIKTLKAVSSHPNIITLHTVIHGPANIYMITALATMDAHDYMSSGMVKGNQERSDCIREIAMGVLQALDFMHTHMNYAHLDIKPENILVDTSSTSKIRAENVRLCDFGYAMELPDDCNHAADAAGGEEKKSVDDEMVPRPWYPTVIGTVGFMAPELVRATAPYLDSFDGRAADMWSLGATLLDFVVDGLSNEWMMCYEHAVRGSGKQQQQQQVEPLSERLQSCAKVMIATGTNSIRHDAGLISWIQNGLLVSAPEARVSASTSLRQGFLRCGQPVISQAQPLPSLASAGDLC